MCRRSRCTGLALATALVAVPVDHSTAEPLPMMDQAQRIKWHAVGRVNTAGFRHKRGCSGTLIAPDLVVTAAHCTDGRISPDVTRHFVAGWYRGQFVAHRETAEVIVHPVYPLARGLKKRASDVAVLRLADPIPPGLIAPVPLVALGEEAPEEALLMGYQNLRPHALSGRSDCPSLPVKSPDLLLFGCEVRSGASGGPVIVDTPEGPALVGVIVARVGQSGHALAVPVSNWLLGHWRQALDRDAARRGTGE